MFKKLFFLCILLVSIIGSAQDLKQVRSQYLQAVKNIETTDKLNQQLSKVNTGSNTILLAYKGAVLTLKAKFSKSKSEKKENFKQGVSLIENAISTDNSNIETRYIRLSVQENSPKFLGYDKNIEEDKKFILDNYQHISSMELKEIVKAYILKSASFNESEKSKIEKS